VQPAYLADDAEVCACAGVTAGRLRACASLEQARSTTRATTGCGGCTDTVRALVAETAPLEGTRT
jgi:assimilatory nitrate reductase electron transfer subunit